MNKKAQMSGVFTAIFIVIAFGLILYMFYAPIETIRLNAISDNTFAQNPLIRIILYTLQQMMWAAWLILGGFFVAMTVAKGGQ